MRKVPAFVVVLILSVHPAVVPAQSTNGSISGRVIDPSHAVIANANVTAVNAGTNFRYETTTNNSGEYYLTNLPPGSYRLEVEKTGFKKLLRPVVELHVQDALAIDFEMAVGFVSDTVRVEAGAPLVNTTSATVSTVVDQTFVENIPLNGRSFQTLIMLTPGVVVTPLWDGLEQDMIDKGVIKKKGEFIESFSASILLGYPSKPDDLAGIAAFLASRDSDYITGQVIMSDGGMVLV